MVSLEKRVREETQNTLARLIDELECNLGKETQAETDERVENEESFMELLEQTCSRIELNMQWALVWRLINLMTFIWSIVKR